MGMLMILCDEVSWLYTYVKIHQIADFKTFCLPYIYSSTKIVIDLFKLDFKAYYNCLVHFVHVYPLTIIDFVHSQLLIQRFYM